MTVLKINLLFACLYIYPSRLLGNSFIVEGVLITDRHWFTNETVHQQAAQVFPRPASRSNVVSQYKPERHITNHFRLYVNNGLWSISTITIGKARHVQGKLVYDGTNIVQMEIFEHAPGAVNNSVARIYESHVPMVSMPSYADIAWTFWGSSCYYSTNKRPYLLTRRATLNNNHSLRLSVGRWQITTQRPFLPQSITVFSVTASNHMVNEIYSTNNIEETYQVINYTNVYGLTLPSLAVYNFYRPLKPSEKPASRPPWETVIAVATNVEINPAEDQRVSGVVSAAVDLRSEHTLVTYLMTNLYVPATNDSVFLNAINRARYISKDESEYKIHPKVLAIGILLILLVTPYFWIARRTPQKQQQQQQQQQSEAENEK